MSIEHGTTRPKGVASRARQLQVVGKDGLSQPSPVVGASRRGRENHAVDRLRQRDLLTGLLSASMPRSDVDKLLDDLKLEVMHGARSVGILGLTTITADIVESLARWSSPSTLQGIYTVEPVREHLPRLPVPVRPISELAENSHDVLVVAADAEKEGLLRAAMPFVRNVPRVIVSGYGHFAFRDDEFDTLRSGLFVPSLANGYPNSLTHLYQCLKNAARLNLEGVVAEFGMFKGGTTVFLAKAVKHFRMSCRVIGFDTFEGFPGRVTFLDMYAHPGCECRDLEEVRRYVEPYGVEVVPGNIVQTCTQLKGQPIVLTFMDTDNYTPARAALELVREQTVVGGAIVFDHFAGVDRFRYTIGERMAALELLEDDPRYFNLHGTGVFCRQRE